VHFHGKSTRALTFQKFCQENPTRVRLSHDKIVSITNLKQDGGEEEVEEMVVYPARHHVTPKEQVSLLHFRPF